MDSLGGFLGGGGITLPLLDSGIPLARLTLTVTLSIPANMPSEAHLRCYLSSLQSDEGKESMPQIANPARNTTPCRYVVFTVDDKAEL